MVPGNYVSESGPSIIEHPAVAPAMCLSSDLGAVQDRIVNVNPVSFTIDDKYLGYAEEFVAMLLDLNDGLKLTPKSIEEVVSTMRTKVTRDRMVKAALDVAPDPIPTVEAFVKKEFYPVPKDLRNISAIAPAHNLDGFCMS